MSSRTASHHSSRFSTVAAAIAALCLVRPSGAKDVLVEPAESIASIDPYYNPGESRGSFEMVMKPYPIPAELTTYVNFVFNVPEDVPDLFHMVVGETILSQPDHLHHFVLNACSKRIDPSLEGTPLDESAEGREFLNHCIMPLGGWAPGTDIFGIIGTEAGRMLGRGIGVEAILMNIHYTDGVYEDAATETLRKATDGLRIHYTRDFRPLTTMARGTFNMGRGPEKLTIPPGEPRFYLTRTCKVDTSCRDLPPERMMELLEFLQSGGMYGAGELSCGLIEPLCDVADLPPFVTMACRRTCGLCDDSSGEKCEDFTPEQIQGLMSLLPQGGGSLLSCESIKGLCAAEGDFGSYARRMCPVTCGFCVETLPDGAPNPLLPESYTLTGVNYHAHLLGREMYTTLLRDQPQGLFLDPASSVKSAPVTVAKDLGSQDFWIYDYQVTIPTDVDDGGAMIRPGDRIQMTCVYDSTARNEPTRFDVSTYDEMCLFSLYITFATPPSLLADSDGDLTGSVMADLGAELDLLGFACVEDDETAMHTGALAADEDGRDIWRDHPLADAEGCTFPHTAVGLKHEAVRCPAVGEEAPSSGADLAPEPQAEPRPEQRTPKQQQPKVSSAASVLAAGVSFAALVPAMLLL